MSFSTQSVTSDGSLVLIDISFDYITRDEVSVFFDSVLTTDWSWVGDNEKKIAFSPAVPVGVEVLVKRTTDISKLRHEFSLGAAFIYQTLDEDLKQVLHIAQEASEANFSGEFFVPINMHNNKITELADGVNPGDAATIGQLQGYDAAAAASAAAAAQSVIDAADASRLVIGTVTTGAPGTPAAVEIVGPAGDQALNFQLPRGLTGPGVAAGGTAGQILRKVDSTGFNTTWVTFVKGDVGLGNVDNTSDANKPISTAQAAGLVSRTSPTGAALIPSGTTGQRPGVPNYGDQRANTTLNIMEWYNGTDWVPMGGGASGAPGNGFVYLADKVVTAAYVMPTDKNGFAPGPLTFGPSGSITVGGDSVFTIVT